MVRSWMSVTIREKYMLLTVCVCVCVSNIAAGVKKG